MPDDWAPNIVQGKGYDLSTGEGQRIWMECLARAADIRRQVAAAPAGWQPAVPGAPSDAGVPGPQEMRIGDREIPGGYAQPTTIVPRLGQRSFRIAVLDTYARRCAITNERTLPALEAAHIRDFSDVPRHEITNGILFRADIHKLFDAGYVTVTPDFHFEVSRRIKEEFENGRDYYKLQGSLIRLPDAPILRPSAEALAWHNQERYLG